MYSIYKMDAFPYLSSYVLLFGVLSLILSLVIPLPWGKFSRKELPLQINPQLAWFFMFIPAFLFLLLGYSEDSKFDQKLPSTSKGWAAFTVLLIYFAWRAIISQLVIFVLETDNGTKQTSLLLVFPFLGSLGGWGPYCSFL